VRAEVRAVARGAPDCPVSLEDKVSNDQKLPNPNGWVTWLAHRTVRCAHRQQPSPTVMWWLRDINTPTTTTPSIQVSSTSHSIQELVHSLLDTNQKNQSLSKCQKSFHSPSDLRESFVRVLCAPVSWIAFFLPHYYSQVTCNQSKRHQECGGPCGV
jgi:hypothetical protein